MVGADDGLVVMGKNTLAEFTGFHFLAADDQGYFDLLTLEF